jgi:hypothetical protein
MSAYKLLLCPRDTEHPPVEVTELADALQAIGFIAAPVTVPEGMYYPTGARFLQLVSFLGCSPAVELDPPSDPVALEAARASGGFCHVYLACGDTLQFRADPRTVEPRCPSCRQPARNWRAAIAGWRENPAAIGWTCRVCGHRGRLPDLQFRKNAAFSRTWVEIRGIHPAEAVPGEALLAHLRTLTDCPWQYLYLQE